MEGERPRESRRAEEAEGATPVAGSADDPVGPAPDAASRGVGAIRVAASATRCPYCHDEVDIEASHWVVCRACLARHHQGCWRENRRCATCSEKRHLRGAPLAGGRLGGSSRAHHYDHLLPRAEGDQEKTQPLIGRILLAVFLCLGALAVCAEAHSPLPLLLLPIIAIVAFVLSASTRRRDDDLLERAIEEHRRHRGPRG